VLIRSRLQRNLIFAFMLVLLIPTGIIAAYSINTASGTLIEKISTEELQSISSEAVIVRTRLLTITNDVLFLSEASSTRSYLPILGGAPDPDQAATQVALSFFQSFLKRSPQYGGISVLNIGGRETLHVVNDANESAPRVVTPDTQTQAGFAYYQRAIAIPAGQVYISLVDLNTTDGKVDQPYVPFIRYSVPLRSDTGSIRGILILKALLKPIVEDKFFQDQTSKTYLVDNDGSYLFSPDESKLYNRTLKNGATLDNDQPNDLRQLYASDQGTLLASKDRPDALQVFARITLPSQPDVRWLLIRQKAISSILAEVYNAQLVIAGISVAALLIAAVVSLLLTYNIVRPVRQLAHVADSVSQGDWNVPVPKINTRDEIAHLAAAFERMLRELRALYTDLEDRVKARTAELETANRQLKIAQEKAEQASKAKSVFLSNMSHELRTPLNVVIGYSSSMLNMPEMFDNVPLPDVYKSYMQLIETSGHYLLGLINDILDLSKIESSNFELRCACVDLQDIFQGVISTSTGLLKGKPVRIQPDVPNDLPSVWADPLRVRQIILNLMSNAIKFTETGQVTLSARVEGLSVRISVADTGIGIPDKALATIFDRFKQVEHDASKNYGGTGLGLDIAKQLCLLHGSDLTVQSTLGQGSTFTFSLPLTTAKQMGVEVGPDQVGGAVTIFDESAVSDVPSGVVLLAENDTETRDMLRRTLEEAGYVVVDTNDGAQAVELASGMIPNLMILDVDLPTMNGWEVLRTLRADPDTNAIPIVICADGANRQRVDYPSGIRYVQKPVTPKEVLAAAKQIMQPLHSSEKGS
jgi:signal transduction histidine kinase/CheY-like chemotaxis protein